MGETAHRPKAALANDAALLERDADMTTLASAAVRAPLGTVPHPALERYRLSIDNIDAALVYMLAERFSITKTVGVLKAEARLPPADAARERRQVARLRSLAESAGLDPEFTEKFLRFIVREVIQHHERAQERKARDCGLGSAECDDGNPTTT